ncbi:hypothetical protein [Leptospira stimsonii]|uniref:Uncharacterized protein n=1 Tax=Leptospira stimsonii TaxID=2202203 RepID=A0ABY2N1D8_9LEPT|nr:hypothetical protein [Leptospira stimsonii]TGK20481.1 hypothetical protein EHO98_08485 [Leptospira stimsonii]TGM14271.1 hypothetical protein EHQ90_11680 [Leptospira stimsonii]
MECSVLNIRASFDRTDFYILSDPEWQNTQFLFSDLDSLFDCVLTIRKTTSFEERKLLEFVCGFVFVLSSIPTDLFLVSETPAFALNPANSSKAAIWLFLTIDFFQYPSLIITVL